MYKECRKDARIVNAAKDAYNALDSLNLHHVLVEWYEVVRLAIGAYASDHGFGLDWIEGHPLHIVMLSKVSDLMGFSPLAYHKDAAVDNAYDWTALLVREQNVVRLVHTDKDCPLLARCIACDECGYPYCDARYGSVEEFIEAQKEIL